MCKYSTFIFAITIILGYSIATNGENEKRLNVVTSTEFLADWTNQIGGNMVNVQSIHNSMMDIHFFEPRPSHIKKCNNANIFITPGLDLDVWVQPLLNASRNPDIQYGTIGYVDASVGVHVLQKPSGNVDMSMGDIHRFGNPHYFYSMKNVGISLKNISDGLTKNMPDNAKLFESNRNKYWKLIQTSFITLKKLMEPFKGTKVIVYHRSWEYFAEEFGLQIVGYFETKPGIPPSAKSIKKLIDIMKKEDVKIVLKEPYYSKRAVKKVAKQTGAKIVELTNFPGSRLDARSYIDNLKANIGDLMIVLKGNF